MCERNKKITSNFTINEETYSNDARFLKVTIDVLHTGENYNGSYFSKDVVDKCVDSIKNTAVLGFIKYDSNKQSKDFKGHEYIVTKTEDGVEEKYCGSAYGVIPESCNPRWITKICSDGEEREFLQVDALLWTKFEDSVGIINRDTQKPQSMELEISSIEGEEDDNGIFHFSNFQFNGCCILGDGIEPAMIDANVTEVVNFTMNDFVKNIQSEISDKYSLFEKIMKEQKNKVGGNEKMSKENFSVMSQFNDISNIVKDFEKIKDRWGDEVSRYTLVDIQNDEVIVMDRSNNWDYYGLKYSMDGDKPVINFETATRKKIVFEDYSGDVTDTDGTVNFGDCVAEIENVAFEKVSAAETSMNNAIAEKDEAVSAKEVAETNYTEVKAELDELKPKYEEFVAAAQKKADEELCAKKDEMLAQFESTLSDCEEFSAIKDNKADYSVDEIEQKCSVILFRKNKGVNFNKQTKNAVIGIPDIQDDNNDGQGYVATKYGDIPVNR